MKKILFIHHAAGWGGAPINMTNIINSLDKSKYSVEVLLLKDSIVSSKLKENGIKFRIAESNFYKKHYHYFVHSEVGYIKWYQWYRLLKHSILWILSRYFYADKELSKNQFDIIHLNSSVLTDWLAPAKKYGKVIIHIREPFRKGKLDFLHYFFTNQMRKYADRIIAISKDNAKRIGIVEKTYVVYNYSDIPEGPIPDDSYTSKKVLYLGGTSNIKGFYTMVNALDYLDKDVKVYFGGRYPLNKSKPGYLKRMIRLITKTYLKPMYKLIGKRGRRTRKAIEKMRAHPNAIEIGMVLNVQKYLNEVCCLVSPFSRPHFSRPVIEAHLYKKPAIGTDVPGMDEVIKHEKNGLVVPKDNPKALADAINSLTSDSQKAKQFGETAYKTAIQKFTPQNILLIQNIYDELV